MLYCNRFVMDFTNGISIQGIEGIVSTIPLTAPASNQVVFCCPLRSHNRRERRFIDRE